MTLLGFLFGLSIGLTLLVWDRVRLNTTLKSLLPSFNSHALEISSRSIALRLKAIKLRIASPQETCQQLENQIARWEQLLEATPLGYLEVDEENRLFWYNQQACKLLGIELPSIGEPRLLLEIVRSYELDELIEQTRDSKKPCQKEWIFQPTCEDPICIGHQQSSILKGYGVPLVAGQVGVFIENRQEVAILAQQRDRAFCDLAHELKTPLTSIRLVAETLQSRLEPPTRNWVDRLLSEVIRLSDLVEVLLDLGQLEKGANRCLNLKTLNLPELIQSAWLSLEPLARKKQLQLDYSGPESLLMQADEHRLYRVLINLLDNSIKYSPAGEKIQVQVSLASSAQTIHLQVIDRGAGFLETALPYVFERFYRGEPSRARKQSDFTSQQETTGERIAVTYQQPLERSPGSLQERIDSGNNVWRTTTPTPANEEELNLPPSRGSGLGLAIVRQIIEAHHGSVSASNHPETGGAWLQVFIPWQRPDLTS